MAEIPWNAVPMGGLAGAIERREAEGAAAASQPVDVDTAQGPVRFANLAAAKDRLEAMQRFHLTVGWQNRPRDDRGAGPLLGSGRSKSKWLTR